MRIVYYIALVFQVLGLFARDLHSNFSLSIWLVNVSLDNYIEIDILLESSTLTHLELVLDLASDPVLDLA